MKVKFATKELWQLLDDVSATAQNLLAHSMPDAEYEARKGLINRARRICDERLRARN